MKPAQTEYDGISDGIVGLVLHTNGSGKGLQATFTIIARYVDRMQQREEERQA
jgi:hypothetical protein